MGIEELDALRRQPGVAGWRIALATWVESSMVQRLVTVLILFNAVILGLETDKGIMASYGTVLIALDKVCLALFAAELAVKLLAYRWAFWRSGWNVFDFLVVAIALLPAAGPLAVLRSMRVLRVLRLLTVVPSLRRVVAAFIHSLPGLGGVMAVMMIFFYTTAVLVTKLFGATHPEWFGTLGRSLFTLFQIMTLEDWAAGIVRPVMETHPLAWLFFVPFVILATFIILNLFIGVIVSTMQELALSPEPGREDEKVMEVLTRIEGDLRVLRERIVRDANGDEGKGGGSV